MDAFHSSSVFNQVFCIVWNLVYEVSLVNGTGLFEAVPADWELLNGWQERSCGAPVSQQPSRGEQVRRCPGAPRPSPYSEAPPLSPPLLRSSGGGRGRKWARGGGGGAARGGRRAGSVQPAAWRRGQEAEWPRGGGAAARWVAGRGSAPRPPASRSSRLGGRGPATLGLGAAPSAVLAGPNAAGGAAPSIGACGGAAGAAGVPVSAGLPAGGGGGRDGWGLRERGYGAPDSSSCWLPARCYFGTELRVEEKLGAVCESSSCGARVVGMDGLRSIPKGRGGRGGEVTASGSLPAGFGAPGAWPSASALPVGLGKLPLCCPARADGLQLGAEDAASTGFIKKSQ